MVTQYASLFTLSFSLSFLQFQELLLFILRRLLKSDICYTVAECSLSMQFRCSIYLLFRRQKKSVQ